MPGTGSVCPSPPSQFLRSHVFLLFFIISASTARTQEPRSHGLFRQALSPAQQIFLGEGPLPCPRWCHRSPPGIPSAWPSSSRGLATSLLSDVLESSKRPQKVGAKREVRRTCLGPFFMSHQQAVPWVYAGWLADGTGPHTTRESEWCGMRAAFHRKGTDHGRSDCHNQLSLGGSLRV